MLKLFLALAVVWSTTVHADKIQLRADPWCPHTCDPSSGKNGYLVDIAIKLLTDAGHTVHYEVLNWARSVAETRSGKHNAIVGAYHTDAEDFIFPIVEQGTTTNCFFSPSKTGWNYKNISSLRGKRIGITADYSYGDLIDNAVRTASSNGVLFESATGTMALELNFKKLIAGRLDAVLEEKSVVRYFALSKNELKHIKSVGCLPPQATFIAFSPYPLLAVNSKKYADILSKGMATLKKSSELQKILKNYGL